MGTRGDTILVSAKQTQIKSLSESAAPTKLNSLLSSPRNADAHDQLSHDVLPCIVHVELVWCPPRAYHNGVLLAIQHEQEMRES